MSKTCCAICLGLMLAVGIAGAEDWYDYPQFRHVSGLPGGAAPVNEDGQLRFGGAFHINIPCAYTPSRDNYSLMFGSGSREDGKVHLGYKGHGVDGQLHAMFGLGEPGHGFAVTGIFVDETWRNTINVQWQAQDETADKPAIAVGVFDIFEQRQKRYRVNGGARSFYIAATRLVKEGDQPLYATLGLGDGRFNGIFGGISWYPSERVNLGLEYDGRVPRPHAAYRAYSNENLEELLWGGLTNFERPLIGFTVQYHR